MDKEIRKMYVVTILPDYVKSVVWGEYKAIRADPMGWSVLGADNKPYGYFSDRLMYNVEPHQSIRSTERYVIRGFDQIKIKTAWNKYVDDFSNKAAILSNFKFPL